MFGKLNKSLFIFCFSTLEKHVKKKHGDISRSSANKAEDSLRFASSRHQSRIPTNRSGAVVSLVKDPLQIQAPSTERQISLMKPGPLASHVANLGTTRGLFGIANTNCSSNVVQNPSASEKQQMISENSDAKKSGRL